MDEQCPLLQTLFDFQLTETVDPSLTISLERAVELQQYFAASPLFSWEQYHNGCEARADAVCLLLEKWQIPNYKAWVFSGRFLKKHVGELKENWKYHVAAMVPVMEDGQLVHYVIDPSPGCKLQTLDGWATNVPGYPHSYHFIRKAHWYIFLHSRNKHNRG